MSDAEHAFRHGLTFAEHRRRMRVHASAFEEVYERLAFVRDAEHDAAPLGAGRVLVLTEDFCVDSVLNLSLIGRLAEASPEAELRIASRDAYPALAARYPGRSGESRVPTVLFLDPAGEVIGHWSERSAQDHAWMSTFLLRDPIPDLVLHDGRPTPVLARWMDRRLAAQLPFFEKHSWRCVRDELSAIAGQPEAASSRSAPATGAAGASR